jgi:hypothetical protein
MLNNSCVQFFNASNMKFLFLWLCNIFWHQEMWCLQLCSFAQDCLFIQGLLQFHINFRIFFLLLWRISLVFLQGLHWICRLSWVEWTFFPTILILPIHGHGISFYIFMPFSIASYSCIQWLVNGMFGWTKSLILIYLHLSPFILFLFHVSWLKYFPSC